MKALSISISLLSLTLLAGCPGKGSSGGGPSPAESIAPAPTQIAAASPAAAPMTRDEAVSRARALLGAWLVTQNKRQFDAYKGLYAQDFVGIRRTPSGEEKRLTLTAWESDRKRLFESPQKVAADDVKIKTWHDGGLAEGEIELEFTQRWQGPSAADHGPKVMRLRAAEGNKLVILREELLSSAKGWKDDNVKPVEKDGTALKSPVTFSAAWNIERNGDVTTRKLALIAKDAAGTSMEWIVPYSECTSDSPDPTKKLGAKNDGGILLEGATNCGLEYQDTFRVVADGAGVVVKDRTVIELHTEDAKREDTGWTDLLRVRLASGAQARGE